MKLCSLQTLVAVLATSTLALGSRIDSSRLPLQARDEHQPDSVSLSSVGGGPADGEYVILSDKGVEQASVVVHKGAVAATEEASLRKLYTWLGAYFSRRDHPSDVPAVGKTGAGLHPQNAVIYKHVPYVQQPVYSPYDRVSASAYGQTHRPSYRPKPQSYQYSNPGYNTNPGYNGYPGYNAGFSSPGYNTNPGYNGNPGYGSTPYSSYAYNAFPYAAYAYNAYLQNLRNAMANFGAQAPSVPTNKANPNVVPSADGSPVFNGFTSSLPVSDDNSQKQDVHSLPGFAVYPPDSLSALVSPVSVEQPESDSESSSLQAEFDAQQEKMQAELELQQKALEAQKNFYEQQAKLKQELELQEKAMKVQREYHEQQEKLKAMHDAQEAAKGDAAVSDAGETPEYDEVEGDGEKTEAKSFLYGAYRGTSDE